MKSKIKLVGIVNVTPDSFSDGGKYLEKDASIDLAHSLMEQGADMIELGADSTRPGSKCVGIEEEWSRLNKLIPTIASFATVGIDTHHAEIARRAIANGASMINDVSAGADCAMFDVITNSTARIVLMHSRCSTPHNFDLVQNGDLIKRIYDYLDSRKKTAIAAGVRSERIVLDPGFGAFISSDPTPSFQLIERFHELEVLGSDLMIACSRKGFLKRDGEKKIQERDQLSARVAREIIGRLKSTPTVYVRAHHIGMHRELFLKTFASDYQG